MHKKSIDFRLCPSFAEIMRKTGAARLRDLTENVAHRHFLLLYYIISFLKFKTFFRCFDRFGKLDRLGKKALNAYAFRLLSMPFRLQTSKLQKISDLPALSAKRVHAG